MDKGHYLSIPRRVVSRFLKESGPSLAVRYEHVRCSRPAENRKLVRSITGQTAEKRRGVLSAVPGPGLRIVIDDFAALLIKKRLFPSFLAVGGVEDRI